MGEAGRIFLPAEEPSGVHPLGGSTAVLAVRGLAAQCDDLLSVGGDCRVPCSLVVGGEPAQAASVALADDLAVEGVVADCSRLAGALGET